MLQYQEYKGYEQDTDYDFDVQEPFLYIGTHWV